MKKVFNQSGGMVDITSKDVTRRTAAAQAVVFLGQKAFADFKKRGSPKGDILETAKVAGIMAAKSTPQIIPMCHPLELGKTTVSFRINPKKFSITVLVDVVYLGKTGVEMEALTGASVAALTIYDMMKWADKGIKISDVKLTRKTGGKSGDYKARNF